MSIDRVSRTSWRAEGFVGHAQEIKGAGERSTRSHDEAVLGVRNEDREKKVGRTELL